MMKRKFCKRLLHINLIGTVLLFGYSVPSSADMFSIAEEMCVSLNHEKGSAPYSECILNVLRERQFQKPSSALVHELKTKIDAGNKKYWGDAIPAIAGQVTTAIIVGAAVEAAYSSNNNPPNLGSQSYGGGSTYTLDPDWTCVGSIGPGGPCSIGPGGGLSTGPGGGRSFGPGGGLSTGPGGGQSFGPGGGLSIGPGGGKSIGPGGGLSIGPGGGKSIGPGGGRSIGSDNRWIDVPGGGRWKLGQ
jgi:hypothetical protein